MGGMYRICFVCTGNICRSPMAEAVFRARLVADGLDGEVVVDSAGTGNWHLGEPADPRTTAALTSAGYPMDHRARQFSPDWFARYDLIVALDEGHQRDLLRMAPTLAEADKVRLLRDYDPAAGEDRDVPDPYYGGESGFADCLRLVEEATRGLLAAVEDAIRPPHRAGRVTEVEEVDDS